MSRLSRLVLLVVALGAVAGCRSLNETRALKHVHFGLAGVQDATLAGIDLDTATELPASAAVAIGAGLLRGELPLSLGLVVGARNPADNPQARLTRFDWTLFLDDREAASGTFDDGPTIAPGDSASFVVPVAVDLLEVAGNNAGTLARMALAVAGRRADPTRVRIEARPYIDTALGQIPLRSETIVARPISGPRTAPRGGTRI